MSKIEIVIPCYNEQSRLPVETIGAFLEKNESISVLLVDDGSTDNTGRTIKQAAARFPGRMEALSLVHNAGKAEAIRQGILQLIEKNDAEWLGYWDADLATPLEEIHHLLNHSNDEVKMLLCSRVKRLGARIDRHAWRHLAGRIMATLISFTLKLPVYDTQCGAKLIHRSVIREAFGNPFMSRWLFDVEIIARINRLYRGQRTLPVIEVPIQQWQDIPGSKLKFQHMLGSLVEIGRIYRHYHCDMKARR